MQRSVCSQRGTVYALQNTILVMKYGGRSVVIRVCIAASGPGQLVIINRTMNSKVCQGLSQDNVSEAVCQLKLSRS